MSISQHETMADYTFVSRYAKYLKDKKRRETYKESVNRTRKMHLDFFKGKGVDHIINKCFDHVEQKDILGSQRSLQFGGDAILHHNARGYNCSASYCDRLRFFQETMYLLLCGVGVGFSAQKHHIAKLPNLVESINDGESIYSIPDSIEGWSDAVGILLSSYMENPVFPEYHRKKVVFDYSRIRPKGSEFSHGIGTAPGPDGLRNTLEKIRELLNRCVEHGLKKLRPIHAYDIVMHIADAVLSGGVRRSAVLCMFSLDDDEMMRAKTGNWMSTNPQRARSNNSVMLLREFVTIEQFEKFKEFTRQFGEPGFIWTSSYEFIFNPCVESQMYCYDEFGNSGWQMCNLTTQNGSHIKTKEDFLKFSILAAQIGTLQSAYTSFPYLGEVTERIVRKENIIGVSITGMMTNKDVLFNPAYQREAAEAVVKANKELAQIIDVNQAARTTLLKPEGSTTTMLGLVAFAGCHPGKGKRVFRRIQANKTENPVKFYKNLNPKAVEHSVWSSNGTDDVITFCCESPEGAIQEKDLGAIEFLKLVLSSQKNWVNYGTNVDLCVQKNMNHNVSNTVRVLDHEWDEVWDFIYENHNDFAGIAFISATGDKDYPQAPFCEVFTAEEIVKEYGQCALFTSGLIEKSIEKFGDLWIASSTLLGYGEILDIKQLKQEIENNPTQWKTQKLTPRSSNYELAEWLDKNIHNLEAKRYWIERAKAFAHKYLNDDLKRLTYLLKDVYNWKLWLELTSTFEKPDFTKMIEEQNNTNVQEDIACAGGACLI